MSSAHPRFVLVALAALLASCGAALREVQLVGEPTHYRGRVVAARGPTIPRTGDSCTVEVASTDSHVLNCRIRVRCRGDTVYGVGDGGYNDCRVHDERFVFAHDHNGTRGDGDPRMYFDLEAGRVIVSDDDPDVEVLVDLMTNPAGYDRAVAP